LTRAVARSLTVLELLAQSAEPLELPAIIERTGIARATAHRLMASLVTDGYVVRDLDAPGFRISFRLAAIGASMLSGLEVRTVALPNMIDLAKAMQHSVSLGFLEGTEVWGTDRIEVVGDRISPVPTNAHAPAIASATGRVIAASRLRGVALDALIATATKKTGNTVTDPEQLRAILAEATSRGYATNDRELYPDASGVAAPIFGRDGTAVAAMSVHLMGALTPEAVQRVVPGLLATTRRTSIELGHRATEGHRVA